MRKFTAAFVVVFIMLLISNSVFAANELKQVPIYDVDAVCKEMYDLPSNSSSTVAPRARPAVNECINMEQSAYDGAKIYWKQLPETEKRRCGLWAINIRGGKWFYVMLEQCLSTAFELQQRETQRSFHP